MKHKYSISKIIASLSKRPWLVLGTICLIISWRWENFSIKSHQENLETARRKFTEYGQTFNLMRLCEIETKALQTFRNHDPNSVSEFDLSTAYANLYLEEQAVLYMGQILNEGVGGRQTFDSLVYIQNNISKYNLQQLVWLSKKKQNEMIVSLDSNQSIYETKVTAINKVLKQDEYLQIILFAMGVILLAVDRGIHNLKQDEFEKELIKHLSTLINKRK